METLLAEVRVFASRIASLRSSLPHLALLIVFGIMTPRVKGTYFLDPQILGAYACLGVLFAAPATAQLFAEEVPPSFQRAKARVLIGLVYGEIVAGILLGAAIATVYLTNHGHYAPTPDWESLVRSAMFGLGASAMLASLAALVAMRFSRSIAMIFLRFVFFSLLVLYFYRGRYLADAGLESAGVCLAVAGVLLVMLRRACR